MKTATTKKSARRTSSKTASKKKASLTIPEEMAEAELGTELSATPMNPQRRLMLIVAAVILVLAIIGYKEQFLLIPARVNGKPIFMWKYLSYLNTTYGKDAMNALTTQAIIEDAIAKSGVHVTDAQVQKELDTIDKEASSSGGLKGMLALQQMTLDQFREQIRIKLAVQEILKDRIQVSQAEVDAAYLKNKDFFKGTSEADAKAKIRTQLENQKLQQEASTWFASQQTGSKVEILFPGLK